MIGSQSKIHQIHRDYKGLKITWIRIPIAAAFAWTACWLESANHADTRGIFTTDNLTCNPSKEFPNM